LVRWNNVNWLAIVKSIQCSTWSMVNGLCRENFLLPLTLVCFDKIICSFTKLFKTTNDNGGYILKFYCYPIWNVIPLLLALMCSCLLLTCFLCCMLADVIFGSCRSHAYSSYDDGDGCFFSHPEFFTLSYLSRQDSVVYNYIMVHFSWLNNALHFFYHHSFGPKLILDHHHTLLQLSQDRK